MAFSIAPLLIHNDAVPLEARNALRAASFAPPEHRTTELEAAASILYRETDLDCSEARELVDLPPGGTCS
ncbi:MAG TPA: hypothetical protein VGJ84_04360 [Polyangiaceae bacterium]|jgi:hypothetical protein